jgi:homoserine dehydrogenase
MIASPDSLVRRADPSSTRLVRLGLLGLGNVGSAVCRVSEGARDALGDAGLELDIACALVRHPDRPRSLGGQRPQVTADPEVFLRQRCDVAIEVLGGIEPARTIVSRLLERGTPVVTANKSLLAAHGLELAAIARRHRTPLAIEPAVVAGVPFLDLLARRPLAGRIESIAGIVSGTCNAVLTWMRDEGLSLADALARACALGLAEPDPSNDVSGRDAVEKLAVLVQQLLRAGVPPSDIETVGLTALSPGDAPVAERLGGAIKPIVYARRSGAGIEAYAGPAFVAGDDPLARVDGVLNALRFRGRSIPELWYAGPGAGPEVTAATILDEVASVVEGRVEPERRSACSDSAACAAPQTAWLVRLHAGAPPPAALLVDLLSAYSVWCQRVITLPGEAPGLAALTYPCARERLDDALAAVRRATACETRRVRALEDR